MDEQKTDTDRKAQAAQQAISALRAAKAEVSRDQAELNSAKSKAKLDVYS